MARRFPCIVAGALLFAGCGGDAGTGPDQDDGGEPTPVASVTLNLQIATIAKGQELQLVATAKAADGAVLTRPVAFRSSNPGAAFVTDGGLVRGAGRGTSEITAEVEGKSAKAVVSVVVFDRIAAGAHVNCALAGDRMYCAGSGYGSTAVPVVTPTPLVTLAASDGSLAAQDEGTTLCGLTSQGEAYCWGRNDFGQLGVGDQASRGTPTRVAGGIAFASISVGEWHSCGLTTEGDAYCWGSNNWKQLGSPGDAADQPVLVAGDMKFTQISAGGEHTCALQSDGRAYCWGRNELGQLGIGEPKGEQSLGDLRATPTAVSGGLRFKQISAGFSHTCAIGSDDLTYCWGANQLYMLGAVVSERCYGDKPCSSIPVRTLATDRFVSIEASLYAACGVTTDQKAVCWGANIRSKLGPNGPLTCLLPGADFGCDASPVVAATGVQAISGASGHHCALRSDQVAVCWGGNAQGQLTGSGSGPQPRVLQIEPTSG